VRLHRNFTLVVLTVALAGVAWGQAPEATTGPLPTSTAPVARYFEERPSNPALIRPFPQVASRTPADVGPACSGCELAVPAACDLKYESWLCTDESITDRRCQRLAEQAWNETLVRGEAPHSSADYGVPSSLSGGPVPTGPIPPPPVRAPMGHAPEEPAPQPRPLPPESGTESTLQLPPAPGLLPQRSNTPPQSANAPEAVTQGIVTWDEPPPRSLPPESSTKSTLQLPPAPGLLPQPTNTPPQSANAPGPVTQGIVTWDEPLPRPLPPASHIVADAPRLPVARAEQSSSNRLWASGEYLLWWIKDSQSPPLVITGPPPLPVGPTTTFGQLPGTGFISEQNIRGVPGTLNIDSATRILIGNELENGVRSGGRSAHSRGVRSGDPYPEGPSSIGTSAGRAQMKMP
jgi:hypothetical protein